MITIAGGAQLHRDWLGTSGDGLLAALRGCFSYYRDGRAGGRLYSPDQEWPAPLALLGPPLLLAATTGTGLPFSAVSFQAYLDGAGCDWHTDKPYTDQAILSLGVTRRFGLRSPQSLEEVWTEVHDGDLVLMPAAWQAGGWEHTVPQQELRGERCSLVFRTGE